jgi:hypothetical protein
MNAQAIMIATGNNEAQRLQVQLNKAMLLATMKALFNMHQFQNNVAV